MRIGTWHICVIMATCIACVMTTSCRDRVQQEAKDLRKYPELSAFFAACGTFSSGTHDLDAGELRIIFTPSTTPEVMFSKLNELALSEGWKVSKDGNTCVFRKNLKRFPSQRKDDIVTIFFNSESKMVELMWK